MSAKLDATSHLAWPRRNKARQVPGFRQSRSVTGERQTQAAAALAFLAFFAFLAFLAFLVGSAADCDC